MKIKLQEYLKRHGFADSNKRAKRLIRDHTVQVNGVRVKSCCIMVSSEKSSNIKVIMNDDAGDCDNHDGSNDVNHEKLHERVPLLNVQQHPQEIQSFCIAFHKPCGMMCTKSPSETYCLNQITDPEIPAHFHPVGRLDQHSHGLLLFSSDGRLTSAMLSPKTAVERIYRIIVKADVGEKKGVAYHLQSSQSTNLDGSNNDAPGRYEEICKLVEDGIQTDYGFFKGRILGMRRDVDRDYEHAKCGIGGGKRNDTFDRQSVHEMKNEEDLSNDANNANASRDDNCVLSSITVAVQEGKKRMVRRLFASIGCFVLDLERLQYGQIKLGNLPRGEWRYLAGDELLYCQEMMRGWEKEGSGWDK